MLSRLGECQVTLGKIVEGTETLERVVHEPLTTASPPAYVAAVERAQKVLAAARPKIAKLTILVEAPAGATPVVSIDGAPVSSAFIGSARPTDPGAHTVEASAAGYHSTKETVTLAEGAVASVTTPPVEPVVEPKGEGPRPETSPRDVDRSTGGSRLAAYVALGMGGVGLVTSVTFGLLALDGRSRLDSACTDKHCPPSSGADLDRARRYAAISTVGFGVALVGATLGATLLLTRSEPTTATTSLRVSPAVGLGSFALVGSF